jgi:hypothetical protein
MLKAADSKDRRIGTGAPLSGTVAAAAALLATGRALLGLTTMPMTPRLGSLPDAISTGPMGTKQPAEVGNVTSKRDSVTRYCFRHALRVIT